MNDNHKLTAWDCWMIRNDWWITPALVLGFMAMVALLAAMALKAM